MFNVSLIVERELYMMMVESGQEATKKKTEDGEADTGFLKARSVRKGVGKWRK